MQDCDRARQFEFWAYPSISFGLVVTAALPGRKRLGWALPAIVAAPLLALALVVVIEGVLF
jgi:hypothetical protein